MSLFLLLDAISLCFIEASLFSIDKKASFLSLLSNLVEAISSNGLVFSAMNKLDQRFFSISFWSLLMNNHMINSRREI